LRIRRYALLAGIVLFCLLLLTVQTRGTGLAVVADLVSFSVTPAQVVLGKLHRGAHAVWSEYLNWKAARVETIGLRAENERLRVQALDVTDVREENRRLRRLLELRERIEMATLTGEVIGRDGGGWVRALTVNRGRADGIAPQMPVIVPEGLIGRVVRVRSGASIVQLLNDPVSAAGAMVQRTRTQGLVEGDPGGGLRFRYTARDGGGITPGDLIVTSGSGEVFPRGLPVGRVIVVQDKGSALFHFAVLHPMVDFAKVNEVLLLTGQTSRDLAGLFARGG
jgi:rod shape-determining protein MreC